MYMCSLVSSVKQHLKFTSLCVNILNTVLFRVLKKGEINILDCNFLSSSYGNESHKSVG